MNVYYEFDIDSEKLYFNDVLAKIPDKSVTEAITSFVKETKLAATLIAENAALLFTDYSIPIILEGLASLRVKN
ncbi:hypothetical protein [Pedobacter hiemivivus]|uniref:Uncharacterized protein n=1 Tax=Pedobacter hiemivivus TaxID=2530454 RepID=A0A4R0NE76_9SPHI|nr:hypothetical protein [Pedobacter hiemivivus]TCC98730.1 hypothetical protein EZ444_05485 [Pedobacter hiemivivus]